MAVNDSTTTELEAAAFEHLPALFDSDPIVFYPYVGLTSIAMVTGFFGNIALFITLVARPDVQKVGREFMANMCLADLCVTGLADPLCLVAAIKGEYYLVSRPALCTLVASLCLTACFCAFFSLGCITASRTVFICHSRVYKKLFSRRKAIVQCCLCWLLSLTAEVGNFLGWGGHFYDRKSESCAWKRTASSSYTFFVGLVLIACPLTLMLAANVKIILKIRATKARLLVAVASQAAGTVLRPSDVWRETARACRTLLGMVLAFCVCWIPYTVVVLIDVDDNVVPPRVNLFVTWLAHLHSAVIVFVHLSNRQIRRAVMHTFLADINADRPVSPRRPRRTRPAPRTLSDGGETVRRNESRN